ncbi:hypothetical protein PsYK624_016780 [Phanerochaete sordida]|uniref:Uncharacterized protein n=1 Tax=Phanerochaete sordida TaxID=48140 RepID=A0A9P3L8K3_9APHY|nr:hypothetical protein PsYK624_016780 [Phanerochaete sordida]
MRNRPGPIGCYSRSCQYPIAPVREGEAAACVSHEGGKAGPQAEDGNSIGKDGGNYTWPGRSVSQENFCPCEDHPRFEEGVPQLCLWLWCSWRPRTILSSEPR